ncbi:MAG: serine/threonine protein kinase [Planctomycetes bacterium]|nr:serine/threonine protein kinase [Planctomycetota bacterium]
MEDLIAECVRAFEEGGAVELRAVLDSHPDQRGELERCLGALRGAGLLPPDDTTDDPQCGSSGTAGRLGEFELRALLGGGGMGLVYRAYQPSLDREVAIKVLRSDRVHLESARQRFRREAAVIAGLRHPGIVPVFAVGDDDGVQWLAMELVEGETLAAVIARLGSRRPSVLRGSDLVSSEATTSRAARESWTDACVRVASQVADALDAAHAAGVLHRDVKPSNVLLAAGGAAKLFDFGLARPLGEERRLTRTGDVVGSPAYMAPEQVRGDAVDARTDVYGLGVLLYELLALELPFLADDELALRERIARGESVPLRHRNPSVPWDVETIVACAMDPEPRRRYPSAGAMRDDLARYLAREPIRARRPGPLLRLRRFCQRRPGLAVGLAATLVVAAGVPTVIGLVQLRARTAILAEQRLAERHLDTALDALDRFLADFGADELSYTPGLDAAGRDLLRDSIDLYRRLVADRPDDVRVRIGLAAALRRDAWQSKRIGDLAAARAAVGEALSVLPPPADPRTRIARCSVLQTKVAVDRAGGDLTAAESDLREALAGLDAAGDVEERAVRAAARLELGRVFNDTGRQTDAETELTAALAELDQVGASRGVDVLGLRAHALRCLATVHLRIGRTAAALDELRAAWAILEPGIEGGAPLTGCRLMAAEVLARLGTTAATSDVEGARGALARSVELYEGLVRDFPDVSQFRRELVATLVASAEVTPPEQLGSLYGRIDRELEVDAGDRVWTALTRLDVARERTDRAQDDPAVAAALEAEIARFDAELDVGALAPRERLRVAHALHSLALARIGPATELAVAPLQRAVEIEQAVAAALPENVEIAESLINSLAMLGLARSSLGEHAEALEVLDRVIQAREQRLAVTPDAPLVRHRLAGTCHSASTSAIALREFERAVAYARRGVELSEEAVAAVPKRAWSDRLMTLRARLCEALLAADRPDDVLPIAGRIADAVADGDSTVSAASFLAQAHARLVAIDPARAEAAGARAVQVLATAAERGFDRWQSLLGWWQFDSLHERPDFRALLQRVRR